MSAPVRTRPARARSGSATAAQRAYTRRSIRSDRWAERVPTTAPSSALRRIPFVAFVIGLLAVGLVTTLWLSTRSAEDSYTLGAAKKEAQNLSEQAEALRRDVSAMDSAPALAQRAGSLGMVPGAAAVHLVVGPDGTVAVVGTPVVAAPPATPVPAAPATPVAAPATPATQAPVSASPPTPAPPPSPATTPSAAPSATPIPSATPGDEQIRPEAAATGQTSGQQIQPGVTPAAAGGAR